MYLAVTAIKSSPAPNLPAISPASGTATLIAAPLTPTSSGAAANVLTLSTTSPVAVASAPLVSLPGTSAATGEEGSLEVWAGTAELRSSTSTMIGDPDRCGA